MDHAGDGDDAFGRIDEEVELKDMADAALAGSVDCSAGAEAGQTSLSAGRPKSPSEVESTAEVELAAAVPTDAPPAKVGRMAESKDKMSDRLHTAEPLEAGEGLPASLNSESILEGGEMSRTADESIAGPVALTAALENSFIEKSHFIADALETVRLLKANRVCPTRYTHH